MVTFEILVELVCIRNVICYTSSDHEYELTGFLKFNFRKWVCGKWNFTLGDILCFLGLSIRNQHVINLWWPFLLCVHSLQHFVTDTL
jgi:hypothetical protein